MARVIRTSTQPDVLLLEGADVSAPNSSGSGCHLLRSGVTNALFQDGNGVGDFRGRVDFILCYVVDGTLANHAGVDHGPAHQTPPLRPVRGIIQLPDNLRQTVNVEEHLSGGVAHEMGHYWLVPGNAQIRFGPELVETPTGDDIARALNTGHGLPAVPIIGRQGSHWSPYIHSDGSFMDGIDHQLDDVFEDVMGLSKSGGVVGPGVDFEFEGEQLTTRGRLSDLELYLMGLPPLSGTPGTRRIQIFEPDWVYPVKFHAGLYAEIADGETWYSGFWEGPNQIRALPTGDMNREPLTTLEDPFDPLNRVVFRIVQRSDIVEFQARVFRRQPPANKGCLYGFLRALGAKFVQRPPEPPDLTSSDVLSQAETWPGADADVYSGWRTLARTQGHVSRVGIAARHTLHPIFARITPKLLCLETEGTVDVQVDQGLVTENPIAFASGAWGATVLDDGSLVLPYRRGPGTKAELRHDTQHDDAPRRIMEAPSGDLVFGGEIELSECLVVPWAGRAANGRTFVGQRREISFTDFIYGANAGSDYESIRQAQPTDGHYRFLFCLVSNSPLTKADRDTQLAELDKIRRAWEPAFDAMTSGRRTADTSIPFT